MSPKLLASAHYLLFYLRNKHFKIKETPINDSGVTMGAVAYGCSPMEVRGGGCHQKCFAEKKLLIFCRN